MQSPVFAAVKAQKPDCHLTVWVAPRGTKILAANDPHIDQVIEAPIKQSLWHHFHLIQQLSRFHFDSAVMLSPGQLWKGAAYLYFIGAKHRIAHAYPFRHLTNSRFLLTDAIDEQLDLHDIEQNLNLLPLLGLKKPLADSAYSFHIPQLSIDTADASLSAWNIPSEKPLIGFHPGSASNFIWKRWPQENFLEVANYFVSKYNAHILIFGGSEEEPLKQFIHQHLPPQTSTMVSENLLTTAAIMQHCRCVVTNDSGLMHLAAASKVPTFGIFGPTDESLTGPRGSHTHVIRATGTKPVYVTEQGTISQTTPHSSLLELTPAKVIETVLSLTPLR